MNIRGNQGFSVMEMILVGGIIGIMSLAIPRLLTPISTYLRATRARQYANNEARICVETIKRVMSNGKAGTLTIRTPLITPTVPLSWAEFESVDGFKYVIAWSNAPMNTIHLRKTPVLGGTTVDTILATHVEGLHFTFDIQDPAIVHVTLRMTVPLDATGTPGSFYPILLSNQNILMIGS